MTAFIAHSTKQDSAIFSTHKITLCATGVQWGKGIPLDELVLTPDGYVAAKKIKPGDTLFDRNGEKTKVVGVFPQGVRDCYKITFKDGRSIITDENHLNCYLDPHKRFEKIATTKELFEKRYYWRKGSNKASFPSLSSPIKLDKKKFIIHPYSLGCLLGDESIGSGSVKLTTADPEIIKKVESLLPGELKIHCPPGSKKIDFAITHKERATTKEGYGYNLFIEELRRLKLFGCLSGDKFIPAEYLYSSPEQRLELLRGLMDTDGSPRKNKYLLFYSVSEALANGVCWLVESLGGKAWIRTKRPFFVHKGERKEGQKCYLVNIILKQFNPFFLKRKADLYFIHDNTEDKTLGCIEPVEARETVCFKVDSPTETFVMNHQHVTHNSSCGAVWLFDKCFSKPGGNFIVCVPNFKTLYQATLPAFKKIFEDYGSYKRSIETFELDNGGNIFFRTNTEPDSIVGITDVFGIWGDEAGKFSLYFWENIQARSALKNCPIMLTTSPYALNWLYRELIKPVQANKRDDVLLVSASSIENPYFSKDSYDQQKKTMDPRRFNALYNGQFERMQGLVYDCFDEVENTIKEISLLDAKLYGAIDWGYTHPFVFLIMAILPSGLKVVISESYKTGLTPSEIIALATGKMKIYPLISVFCDPSRPEMIKELCNNQVPAVGADNDIDNGIARTYTLLKTRTLRLLQGQTPHTIDELETYHYPEPKDLKPDQTDKDQKPVDAQNHVLDCLRYIVQGTLYLDKMRAPHVNDEVPQKIKRLESTEEHITRLQKPKRLKFEKM